MKKLFTNGIGQYKKLNAKKVGQFIDRDGKFWKNARVSVWRSDSNDLSSWRRIENEDKKCRAKFVYHASSTACQFDYFETNKVSDYFKCLEKDKRGEIIERMLEPEKFENEGYWIAHDGSDFVIFRLNDAWGHCDSAEFALDYHGINSANAYDDFIDLGITRIFTSGNHISVTAPEYHLNDILYLLSISPQFKGYAIETVSHYSNGDGRDKKYFNKIQTGSDLLEYYS